ncbi:sigma-70 family RNA polymerase sigma factor [Stigmatella hybrida]|uniref:sigma-70 family RNA polymerase sigma factor n=1 Tax=Stigmatella hybrida TaxID=394097 RepID=UPI001CDB2A53|nr:sigma-70 family RNA polymerase sigma factor [Stigmatella hybrida]
MEQVPSLATAFLMHAKARFVPPEHGAAFESLLVHAWETARAQWPAVALPAESFVAYLAERLPETPPQSPLEPLLAQMSLAELFLACACVRGIPSALELFERHYLARLPALLRSPKQPDAMIDDVCQLVRVKILVPTGESGPKIAEYTGRGALLSWVRVTAVRIAIKLQAVEKPTAHEDTDTLFAALPAPGADAELDLIKRRHHTDFRQAVSEAFSGLSNDERHLFRLYFVDQLSMYELAALFRVNQSTVSRWLKTARQRIYEETQRRLQARLGLSPRDFKSYLAVLDSQLELGISQLLRAEDEAPRAQKPDCPP